MGAFGDVTAEQPQPATAAWRPLRAAASMSSGILLHGRQDSCSDPCGPAPLMNPAGDRDAHRSRGLSGVAALGPDQFRRRVRNAAPEAMRRMPSLPGSGL